MKINPFILFQALLANMSAFYAIYYGPKGLKKKAIHTHYHTLVLAEGLKNSGNTVLNELFFDTIKVKPKKSLEEIKNRAESKCINLRYYDDGLHLGISLDETITSRDINDLLDIFESKENFVIIILISIYYYFKKILFS
jgi:glycine dehydrogenase